MRVWASAPLPWTCSSSPGSSLSLATSATTSPPSSKELCQSADVSVLDATYIGSALSLPAIGSAGSVTRGQWPAKIWYVLRPSRNALACSNQPLTATPKSWSPYGNDQPPYGKSPSRSSSGPPGACRTPSRVRKVCRVSRMLILLRQIRGFRYGLRRPGAGRIIDYGQAYLYAHHVARRIRGRRGGQLRLGDAGRRGVRLRQRLRAAGRHLPVRAPPVPGDDRLGDHGRRPGTV